MGLTRAGLGQSTCVGMGGDPVHGLGFKECLELFEADPRTEAVVLVGEIGGDDEERAAAYAAAHMTKPVVAYIAGFTAPPGKRMGHAGAIISGSSGTAAGKAAALEEAASPLRGDPTRYPRWSPRRWRGGRPERAERGRVASLPIAAFQARRGVVGAAAAASSGLLDVRRR